MCNNISSTHQVQGFSVALVVTYIITAVYWFLYERSTRTLQVLNVLCETGGDCKKFMDITVGSLLILNTIASLALPIAAALKNMYCIGLWLAIFVFQIPVTYFASLLLLFWHQLMDPRPALIGAGLLLLYGCVLLASWVSAYNLFHTIQLSKKQHRVTALVMVCHNYDAGSFRKDSSLNSQSKISFVPFRISSNQSKAH